MKNFDWLTEYVKFQNNDECWPWPYSRDKGGYGRCWVNGKMEKVHQLALKLSGEPRPPSPNNHALHSCNNPPCFNPRHLRWGGNADNRQDQIRSGTQVIKEGETNGRARLTENEVLDILHLVTSGKTQVSVAEQYSVSSSIISDIINGKRWKSVTKL
ncbi:MAG: hypothetical protein LC650_00275 [Actinobacteria bacterium]|nr:hypothetical protein [Actinomycetota bacterium]